MTPNQYRRARNLAGLKFVAAEAAVKPFEDLWRREWDEAPDPFTAFARWVSPEKKAERARDRAGFMRAKAHLEYTESLNPNRKKPYADRHPAPFVSRH
jgi:hypothetical protein